MNKKQLADVLIKILGLSLCAHGILPLLLTVEAICQFYDTGLYPGGKIFPALLNDFIPIGIGIAFILKSRALTEKLFKDE